jgi:hypothetical protein
VFSISCPKDEPPDRNPTSPLQKSYHGGSSATARSSRSLSTHAMNIKALQDGQSAVCPRFECEAADGRWARRDRAFAHDASRSQLICSTGNFANSLSSPLCKNTSLRDLVETALLILASRPHKWCGSRSSRTLRRDAITRPASRSLSSDAHSRDPVAPPDDISPQEERGEVTQKASRTAGALIACPSPRMPHAVSARRHRSRDRHPAPAPAPRRRRRSGHSGSRG